MNQSLNTATGAGQQPTHLSQGNKGSAKKGKGAKDTNARNLKTADVDPNKFLVYSVVDAIPLSNDRDLRDAVEEQVNIPLDNNDQCAGSVTSRIQLNNKGTLDVRLISPDELGTDFIKKCAHTHAISSKLASIAGEKAHVIDSILPKFKGALLASSSATAGGRAEAWTRSVLAELSKIMDGEYFELACIELEAHVGESAKSILKGLYEINSHEDEVHVGKHNLNQKVGQAILEAKQKGMSSIVLKIKLPLVAFVLMLGPRVAKDQFKEYCPGGESFQKVEDVSMIEENVPQRRLAFSLEDVEAINRTLDADDEEARAAGEIASNEAVGAPSGSPLPPPSSPQQHAEEGPGASAHRSQSSAESSTSPPPSTPQHATSTQRRDTSFINTTNQEESAPASAPVATTATPIAQLGLEQVMLMAGKDHRGVARLSIHPADVVNCKNALLDEMKSKAGAEARWNLSPGKVKIGDGAPLDIERSLAKIQVEMDRKYLSSDQERVQYLTEKIINLTNEVLPRHPRDGTDYLDFLMKYCAEIMVKKMEIEQDFEENYDYTSGMDKDLLDAVGRVIGTKRDGCTMEEEITLAATTMAKRQKLNEAAEANSKRRFN